jgi:hypothetical protein
MAHPPDVMHGNECCPATFDPSLPWVLYLTGDPNTRALESVMTAQEAHPVVATDVGIEITQANRENAISSVATVMADAAHRPTLHPPQFMIMNVVLRTLTCLEYHQ